MPSVRFEIVLSQLIDQPGKCFQQVPGWTLLPKSSSPEFPNLYVVQ